MQMTNVLITAKNINELQIQAKDYTGPHERMVFSKWFNLKYG
jgi:hypothetical protein